MANIGASIIVSIPHCHNDKVWAVKMVNIGVSIIISIPHFPIDYFIPSCWLDDILTAHMLSIELCGMLTMIDTPILAIFMSKKSLKVWKRLYIVQALSEGQLGILMMIDTPILAYMRKNIEILPHFLILVTFLNVERDVSTRSLFCIIYFILFFYFFENVKTSL